MTIRLALTPGCPAGIGPEVLARAIVDSRLARGVSLHFFASAAQLVEGARRAHVPAKRVDDVVVLGRGAKAKRVVCTVSRDDDAGVGVKAGAVTDAALASQRDALVRACAAAGRGDVDGIVTGPVRKKALVVDGVAFPGQTEVVERFLSDGKPPLMVFAGGPFLLGLATVHIALADVPRAVTADVLDRAIERLRSAAQAMASSSSKKRPRIVVLGVNPHAGEGGVFGREEIDVVAPAVERARARGLDVAGPVAADGFFADVARGTGAKVDAVLAMAHDQGLAPYKLLVGGEGINVTWGCRVPRTSPDHGTADAIAGKGKASSSSMKAAIELCAKLARPSPGGAHHAAILKSR